MKVITILILIVFVSCASNNKATKEYHVHVKEKTRTAQDKDYTPYWALITFSILVYGYTLTQPKE